MLFVETKFKKSLSNFFQHKWYNLEEEDEEESDENEQESEENEEEGEEECREEGEDGEDQGQGNGKVNDEEQNKNHFMNFVLQLKSVAGEDDDKTQIERLWKKQLNLISMLKDSEIDSNDTDSENEDDTDSEMYRDFRFVNQR